MPTLICGSLAFDTIMLFPDRFKNYILPDQIHILNVCFVNPDLRREYGGCAGNIAYNLKLLGGDPLPMGTVGKDFADYRERLISLDINDDHILEIPELYSAQCSITTDRDNNQITAFHPGAMGEAHRNHVSDAKNVTLGIVAPDGRDAMIQHGTKREEYLSRAIVMSGGSSVRFHSLTICKFAKSPKSTSHQAWGSCCVDVQSSGEEPSQFPSTATWASWPP